MELICFIEKIKSEDGKEGNGWHSLESCLYDVLEKYQAMLEKKQEEHQQQLQQYEEKLKSLQGKISTWGNG